MSTAMLLARSWHQLQHALHAGPVPLGYGGAAVHGLAGACGGWVPWVPVPTRPGPCRTCAALSLHRG